MDDFRDIGAANAAIRMAQEEIARLRAEVTRLTRERDANANWPAIYRVYEEQVSTEKTGRRNAEAERDALRACVTQLVGAVKMVCAADPYLSPEHESGQVLRAALAAVERGE